MKGEEPYLLYASLIAYGLGALLAIINKRFSCTLSHISALVGGITGILAAIISLSNSTTIGPFVLKTTPFTEMNFKLDSLSAYFLLLISLLAIATSIYAVGYLKSDHHSSAGLGVAFNGFLFTMVMVIAANNVFAFLFAWEAMSLVSFFLVIHDDRSPEVRRAGFLYLAMTHISAAFLLIGFFILSSNAGSLDFDSLRSAASRLPAIDRDFVFLLSLVAFGTKAGIIPLHIWLPRAHPAAPSHVSALMSGVMLKIAIYGLIRVCWELAGPGPVWWGALILVLGAVSAVLGVLYALMEHDLKRLLAYHSVENIGIILLGFGAALVFASFGNSVAAAAALAACLFHVLNHAVFKALLFLGAGAVQQATNTRDVESLGGLIHRMPITAMTFLIGAAAISALPPLNGFVSEWLTFQSLLSLTALTSVPLLAIGAAVAAGLLALTGGLAAFCFVKAFGVVFLGLPRGQAAAEAKEVGRPMLFGMGLLAFLCFAIGLLPTVVVGLLAPVTKSLTGAVGESSLRILPSATTPIMAGFSPLMVMGLLVVFGVMAIVLGRTIGGPGRTRTAPTWVCGIDLEPAMQYTAAALAKPVRIIFQSLVRPYREVEREQSLGLKYFTASVHYESGIHPVYERYLYKPVVRFSMDFALWVRLLQTGSLRVYLAYIFITVIAVLLLARAGGPL